MYGAVVIPGAEVHELGTQVLPLVVEHLPAQRCQFIIRIIERLCRAHSIIMYQLHRLLRFNCPDDGGYDGCGGYASCRFVHANRVGA